MEKVCFPSGHGSKALQQIERATHAIAARYATCVTERVSNLITRRAAVKLRKYSSWAARAPEALRWPLAAGWRKTTREQPGDEIYCTRSRQQQQHIRQIEAATDPPAGLRPQFVHNLRRTALHLHLVLRQNCCKVDNSPFTESEALFMFVVYGYDLLKFVFYCWWRNCYMVEIYPTK